MKLFLSRFWRLYKIWENDLRNLILSKTLSFKKQNILQSYSQLEVTCLWLLLWRKRKYTFYNNGNNGYLAFNLSAWLSLKLFSFMASANKIPLPINIYAEKKSNIDTHLSSGTTFFKFQFSFFLSFISCTSV